MKILVKKDILATSQKLPPAHAPLTHVFIRLRPGMQNLKNQKQITEVNQKQKPEINLQKVKENRNSDTI